MKSNKRFDDTKEKNEFKFNVKKKRKIRSIRCDGCAGKWKRALKIFQTHGVAMETLAFTGRVRDFGDVVDRGDGSVR